MDGQGLLLHQPQDTRGNLGLMNMSACPGPLTNDQFTIYSRQETVTTNCYFSVVSEKIGVRVGRNTCKTQN